MTTTTNNRATELLIEPLWNWNRFAAAKMDTKSVPFNRTTMELKPPTILFYSRRIGPFNRTTMELKPMTTTTNNRATELLIEPLWNWNSRHVLPSWNWSNPFNRTTMELKQICALRYPFAHKTFNRTTMELKLWTMLTRARSSRVTFNRTTMELKRTMAIPPRPCIQGLLIEPLWNWNAWPWYPVFWSWRSF